MKKELAIPGAVCYTEDAVNETGCPEREPMNRQPKTTLITALYERLSRDDELQGPSNSIKNQQAMLEDYAEKHGFSNIVHFTDDGISGTRWDRPGFVKLMDEIEAGNVAIVLCKDTSRLGRDYLRVGLFMETLRQKGVRLIAIGDNVDTAQGEDDFMPFRNIFAEWHARDTSRKITAVKKAKGMSGNYTSSQPVYGYIKSEDKKQRLIDPEAAGIVRRVFNMIIEGYGACQIASILQRERILSPGYYIAQKGFGNHVNRHFEDPYRWNGTTICTMLERPEYMGHMVNFKSYSPSFKDKKRIPIAPDDWVIFEDRHEAIIEPETWHLANEIRQRSKRRRPDSLGEPHPLSGLLYCADCGSKLRNLRGISKQTGKPRDSYNCDKAKHGRGFCSPHTIQAATVKTLVLDTLRTVCTYARENEEEFSRQVNEMFSAQQADTVKAQRKKLTASQKRRDDLDRLIQNIYEDKVSGALPVKRYEVLSAEYEREQAELEQTIMELQAAVDSFDDSAARAENFLELTRRYKDFSELTAPMLHEFVQKIVVHERAEPKVKCTSQKVEIHLNFIGEYELPITALPEPDPAEIAGQERLDTKRKWQREYRLRRKENGGKPLGTRRPPADPRTPEQKAADDAARKVKQKEYQREYQREWQRKRAKERRDAKIATAS